MQLEPQINQTVVSQFKFGTVKVPSRLTVFHINPLVDYTYTKYFPDFNPGHIRTFILQHGMGDAQKKDRIRRQGNQDEFNLFFIIHRTRLFSAHCREEVHHVHCPKTNLCNCKTCKIRARHGWSECNDISGFCATWLSNMGHRQKFGKGDLSSIEVIQKQD